MTANRLYLLTLALGCALYAFALHVFADPLAAARIARGLGW